MLEPMTRPRTATPASANAGVRRRVGTVPLSDGVTWTRQDGPTDGRPILLIHGATVPHWEFDGLAPVLAQAGFRVFRYDLYGHGRSARPDRRYDRGLFVRQAEAVMDHFDLVPAKTAVLGHSMGAAVAAALAGRRPIPRLILMAPMLDFSSSNPFGPLLRTPVIGEAFMALVGRPGLIRRRRIRYGAIGRPDLARRFRAQTRRTGFWNAMLRIERDGALGDQRQAYFSAARRGVRTLIVRGTDDPIIPAADTETIAELFSIKTRIDLDGLAHNLMLVDPVRVGEQIVTFLRPESSATHSSTN